MGQADGMETPNDLIDILKNPKHARQSTIDAVFLATNSPIVIIFTSNSMAKRPHRANHRICYDAQTLSHNIQTTLARHGIDYTLNSYQY